MDNIFSADFVVVVALISAIFSILLVALMYAQTRMQLFRQSQERHTVELEMLRASLEAQVYALNARLTGTPARWRDVNGLILEGSSSIEPNEGGSSPLFNSMRFLHGLGLTPEEIKVNPKKVFVLTAFHDEYLRSYRQIQNAVSSLGLAATRGDEVFLQANILSHIVEEMLTSALIIANIDGRNPNVFYELGIAHGLGKPSIILSSSLDDLPFDFRNQSVVFWKDEADLERGLTKAIARFGLRTNQ